MADLSPELASRIQSLEASYGDNPGRYFVALAGAWREGGDIARAEEILRENLKRFPGLSAHVLLGRCLADRGAFQEAANEFHYVLSIDSQNLIALRTLAEMAAAGGRRAEAERWYNELLAVDPMNVEARAALQQLARAGAAPAAPAAPAWGDVEPAAGDVSAYTPAGPAGGAEDDDGEFGMIDLSAPDASPADASGVAADDDADVAEWGDLSLDGPEETPQPAAVDTGDAQDAGSFDAFGFGSVRLDEEPAPEASGWMDTDARQDVGESAAADFGDLPLLDDGLIDAPLAGADLPLLDLDDTVDDAGLAAAASEPGAGFGFDFGGPAAVDDAGYVAHEQDGHDRDAEMVTETMAELYASQGLYTQAADVYRELIRQRGEEPGLARRLAEIETQMQPGESEDFGSADFASTDFTSAETTFAPEPVAAAPDWLESVDAFARGGPAEPELDAGVPGQDLSPAQTDETLVPDSAGVPEAAGSFPSFEPAGDFASFDPVAADEFASLQPVDEFASLEPAAAEFAPPSEPVPELAGAAMDFADAAPSASADPFADSFAGGFEGTAQEPAPAAVSTAGDDRQAWESPSVAETEPIAFDILVVEDEDGTEVPAPADVVADMSADWALAAAPLDDDEEAAEAELTAASAAPAVPAFTAPAFAPPSTPAGGRTMRGYFDSLLTWQPAPVADVATYELTAEGSAITVEAAEPAATDAPSSAAEAEALPFDLGAAETDVPAYEPEPAAFPAAPAIPTFDAPAFQPPPPAFEAPDASAEDEPWAAPAADAPPAADDEPWATPLPGESAPEAGTESAPESLPLLDLDEPWAEAPAAPRAEPDLGAFTLAEDELPGAPAAEPSSAPAADEGAEELLPWEVPAEPADAAPEPAVETSGGGFSFEDFFSGAPAESAAPAPAAEPEPELPAPPAPEEEPAFIPSYAEPTPPPTFAAPTPPPAAPSAPAASAAEGEEDEDLESFQAWLQSLKR
jgi:tetratricopeptide (TPR) repeat protein